MKPVKELQAYNEGRKACESASIGDSPVNPYKPDYRSPAWSWSAKEQWEKGFDDRNGQP